MKAFLTGSQVYGFPTPESDIDLVVHVSAADAKFLFSNKEPGKPLMFGDLNLVVLTDEQDWIAWRAATDECTRKKPITRDEAITIFIDHGVDDYILGEGDQ